MWFIIIFIALPLAEIAAFIKVGENIGTPTTLFLCLITAIIGGYFVKKQGLHTLTKAQKHLNQGQIPVQEMFDGICLIATGALMITPGFVTDTIGFLLLIPIVRILLKNALIKSGKFSIYNEGYSQRRTYGENDNTIEAEYERVDTRDKKD